DLSPQPPPQGGGDLHHRKLWLAIGFGLVALVIYLSLTPKPIDAGSVGEVKVGHFIAYGVLMLWFAQLYGSFRARLALFAAFVLLGVGLEFAQSLTTYRSFSPSDMLDNAIGALTGFALAGTPLGSALTRIERLIRAG
ncbi:MAG TPA: VanZ family protein, partial [Usitatibacter sp.]|nr:VanZ family protein [Usitatibacter sp.]